ncbi:MAG: hypothetical protein Q8P42_01075 [Gallionella sp.]|nr:hypothetical protein [Gallionella sp.]
MPDTSTHEERKARSDAQDALIKHVFDHLRNVLICVALIVASGAVLKYRADLPFDSAFNIVISVLVFISACGLFVWNMIHGIEKIIRPVKGTKKVWRIMPFTVAYMLIIIIMFQAATRAQIEQQLQFDNKHTFSS